MKIGKVIILCSFVLACSDLNERPVDFNGTWKATWSTEADDFKALGDKFTLTMGGYFVFEADSVSIIAQGFPGCIFGEDTLVNTQSWEYTTDSLHLILPGGNRGLSYVINEKSKEKLKLTLMNDIVIELVKMKQAL
jgi:hypothetical protein